MERTQIRCGIIIPAYVNLKLYDYGFYTTITFHISADMVEYLHADCNKHEINNGRLFVFAKRNSKGKMLHYYCVRRHYTDLNQIHDACYRIANYDKLRMMGIMRLAKINSIYSEIDCLVESCDTDLPF